MQRQILSWWAESELSAFSAHATAGIRRRGDSYVCAALLFLRLADPRIEIQPEINLLHVQTRSCF